MGATAALVVAPLGSPAAHAALGPPIGFAIGSDARLYGSSLGPPVLVDSAAMAPPGAGLAAFMENDGRVSAYAIGLQGGLVMTAPTVNRPGNTIIQDGPSGLAPPGAPLSGVRAQGWDHIFFVGGSGTVYRASYRWPARPGPGPQPWGGAGAPRGGIVAAALLPTSAPVVVFVGNNGGLYSVWETGSGSSATILHSPPGTAQPGGGVALVSTTVGMQAFFTGLDGRLWTTHITGGPLPDPWAPVAVTAAGVVPSGASLTAAQLPNGALAVSFTGNDGAVRIATTDLTGSWLAPVTITPTGVTRAGSPVSLAVSGNDLYTGWCGNEIWWWWRWEWPKGPFPQPWIGELTPIRVPTPGLIREGFTISFSARP
ncbi:hypothetical protein [Rhizomonospora bruguierae]|uniref:hypothetical protein n=1 Tax=Rhizomonospora bruguierae TaxID=1581705 RepID=UPI001BD050B2|nr:hypothetical protein [Micromonospora sp. NBRC 107566]